MGNFAYCNISSEHGSAEGYVCDLEDENWRNYLAEIGVRDDVERAIDAAASGRVAVFRNMNVDEESREDGHGRALAARMLQQFEEQNAEVTILFADCLEENTFDLPAWYGRLGFEHVDNDREAPFMMIASEEVIAAVRAATGWEPKDDAPNPA